MRNPPAELAGVLLLTGLLAPVTAPAAELRSLYEDLRSVEPAGEAFDASGVVIERDAFRFRFTSGTLQLLDLGPGRIVGAVFDGSGAFEIEPASEMEREHLAVVTGESDLAALRVPIDRTVLLFTDGTASEIARASARRCPPSPRAGETYRAFRAWEAKELRINLQIALLEALPRRDPAPAAGFLFAWVPGGRYSPGLAAFDPAGLEEILGRVDGETSSFLATGNRGGLWYCSGPKSSTEGRPPAAGPPPFARALWYGIDTTISPDGRMGVATTIQLVPTSDDLRVLRLNLSERQRLRRVEAQRPGSAEWLPLDFIQEAESDELDAAVLFDRPPARGATLRLRLTTEGRGVLRDAGDGNFLVGARDNWYPNLGWFHDLSVYELTYRHPKEYQVVSVGARVAERIEGDTAVAVWRADRPIRVAGFNYGRFREIERTDPASGVAIRVYTSRGTPDYIQRLNHKLLQIAASSRRTFNADMVNFVSGIHAEEVGVSSGPNLGAPDVRPIRVDPEILASAAIAEGLATARIGAGVFGPLPDSRIAITQQTQAFFGQSWPGLLYLPYTAALDRPTRREIGLEGEADFLESIVPHEFAHQWWGQLVGWKGYRDRWLSEGFAEFTAALVLESSGDAKKTLGYWDRARRRILEKPPGSSVSNAAAGPIIMGQRLFTARTPWAYDVIVYSKGAYVLRMLREWMRDRGAADPDRRFFEAMSDFARRSANGNPSTRDFEAAVERHVPPNLRGAEDGRLDWFFRQWVYGTDIPRLRDKLRVAETPGGGWRATGSITQDGVTPDFRTVVPIFAEIGRGELTYVASLTLVGNVKASIDLPLATAERPRRVLANPRHEVLSRD
jgi:hypothetical protein